MAVYRPSYKDQKTGEQKQSATWWYDFVLAGRRYRDSTNTTRKTIAVQAEKARRLQIERALAGMPSEATGERVATVKERVDAYLKNYRLNHRPKSIISAEQRLAHVKRLMGGALLVDLTEDKIHDFIRTRQNEGAAGRTCNMEIGELSRAIKVKWSIARPNVRKMEENHETGRALSPDEERALLDAAGATSPNRNIMMPTFLRIALLTGMRVSEIASLRWSQIDFESGVVTVGRKAKTKQGSGRQIPMHADLKAVLEAHASWYAQRFGEIRPEWCVFAGRKGKPVAGKEHRLDPTVAMQSVTSSWERIRKDAGVSCRFHDLRHTVATKLAEAGVPESTMLSLMGHMSRAMLERYSHIRMKAKRVAVEALGLASLGLSIGVPKESPKVTEKGLIQ